MNRCIHCPCWEGVTCVGRCGFAATGDSDVLCAIAERSLYPSDFVAPPPKPPDPPTPSPVMSPLMQMAVDCIYRDITCSTCEGVRCWAGYGNNRKGQATTLANCESCVGRLVGLGGRT